jgi:hypothetical protein
MESLAKKVKCYRNRDSKAILQPKLKHEQRKHIINRRYWKQEDSSNIRNVSFIRVELIKRP